MELEIEILWNTDTTRLLETSGVDIDWQDYEHRTMMFYQVDAIAPCPWGAGIEFCSIWVGGEKWTTPYTYEQMKELIRKAKA